MNPDQIISPAVFTSKAATEDMSRIQSLHAQIVKGMANQAQQVAVYQDSMKMEKQQQDLMKTEQQKMQMEQEKSQREMDVRMQEKQMDYDQKQAELELKRTALSQE